MKAYSQTQTHDSEKEMCETTYKETPMQQFNNTRTLVRTVALLAILSFAHTAAHAHQLSFSYTDETGDLDFTGGIDLHKVTMTFDNATGAYAIVLTTTDAAPFNGQFRINVNLFNPDAPTGMGWFTDNVRDFSLFAPTTSITLTGVRPFLQTWQAGQRVATNNLIFGNPPGVGVSAFRSNVLTRPFFTGGEDSLLPDLTGVDTIVPATPQAAAGILMDRVAALLSGGVLTQDQAAGLTDKLQAIIEKLNQGKSRPACNQFNAFINQVQAFIGNGILPESVGQSLIDAAQAARTQIGC
jgi:hypothetical protein